MARPNMAESLFGDDANKSRAGAVDRWYGAMFGSANPIKELFGEDIEDSSFDLANLHMSATPSTNTARPRTLEAGYDYSSGTMYVVFRDGTWWEYHEVPVSVWDSFKATNSPGKFLAAEGFDGGKYSMGKADLSSMPTHRRTKINDNVLKAQQLYES